MRYPGLPAPNRQPLWQREIPRCRKTTVSPMSRTPNPLKSLSVSFQPFPGTWVFISRGTPGKKNNVHPFSSISIPGAVPRGLGTIRAPSGISACFKLAASGLRPYTAIRSSTMRRACSSSFVFLPKSFGGTGSGYVVAGRTQSPRTDNNPSHAGGFPKDFPSVRTDHLQLSVDAGPKTRSVSSRSDKNAVLVSTNSPRKISSPMASTQALGREASYRTGMVFPFRETKRLLLLRQQPYKIVAVTVILL